MNQVNLIGRLSKDADLRWTKNGKCVGSFGLAVTRPFTFGDDQKTDFFNIVCWMSENSKLGDYLLKGTQVCVSGYITNRSWEDDNGKKHFITEIITNNGQVELLGNTKKSNQKADSEPSMGKAENDDSKIPF